jgi:hypothetical protein
MTLLAIPLGIKVHRRDTALNIIITLCLCMGYYFVMAILSLFGESPRMRPDISAWILNVIFVGLGHSYSVAHHNIDYHGNKEFTRNIYNNIVIGFDDLVDTIVHVVDVRDGEKYTRIEIISDFGKKIMSAAGESSTLSSYHKKADRRQ